ncbi:DUF998 domain-containing protein [Actinokineospora enzanensis]|uniref:DUF998 domain-containing protein n=1 Tax=Actinokineospora enzanensis TaxID=155975 RepID=UPI0003740A2B|nr:DUF998 domain-containing protein [Actinokineospora enzanensis]
MATRGPALALAALCTGVTCLLILHVIPPTSDLSPVRRTISEYALGPNKWLFDLAILLVAAGSALGFALIRDRTRPLVLVLGAVWVVSLLAVVAFTKNNWAIGPSTGGMIHRYASVAAFLSLPLAVLTAAGRALPPWRWSARALGLLSLTWFAVIVVGAIRMLSGGAPWWTTIPLGLVERVIAGSAVAAFATLLIGLTRPPTRPPIPA